MKIGRTDVHICEVKRCYRVDELPSNCRYVYPLRDIWPPRRSSACICPQDGIAKPVLMILLANSDSGNLRPTSELLQRQESLDGPTSSRLHAHIVLAFPHQR